MSKIDKKKERLKEQIVTSEAQLVSALTKKKSGTAEVSIPTITLRISKLKAELASLNP